MGTIVQKKEFITMKSKLSSVWAGILVLAGVLYFGIFHGFKAADIFFNEHALILVFGGTLGVTLLCYPFALLLEVFDFLVYGFLFKKNQSKTNIVFNLLESIHRLSANTHTVKQMKFAHNFTADALGILADPKYKIEDVETVLESIKVSFNNKYSNHAKVMLNISKFPPALGLLGASTGMISMMVNLGSGGAASIGAAMAVALTATFWGIALANFAFLPLADYANRLAEDDLYLRELIIDATILTKEGVEFSIISEAIANRLPVYERFEVLFRIKNMMKDTANTLEKTTTEETRVA